MDRSFEHDRPNFIFPHFPIILCASASLRESNLMFSIHRKQRETILGASNCG
jgi:hypothetical protein